MLIERINARFQPDIKLKEFTIPQTLSLHVTNRVHDMITSVEA